MTKSRLCSSSGSSLEKYTFLAYFTSGVPMKLTCKFYEHMTSSMRSSVLIRRWRSIWPAVRIGCFPTISDDGGCHCHYHEHIHHPHHIC